MIIRKMQESDLMNLYGTISDPEVMKYIEEPYSLEQTKAFLKEAGLAEPPLIYACEEDGEYIGYTIYHEYDKQTMEIGWLLNKNSWGKGYACRLTELLIEKAKQDGKDVIIECAPEQSVTKHIAEKYDFLLATMGICGKCDTYKLKLQGENVLETGNNTRE